MEMNTRNMRRKGLCSKSDSIQSEQSQSNSRNTNLSDTEAEEDINDAALGKFSSPTFNIHIHMPYYDSRNSKIFLPKIQPIINLHFDELARNFENNIHKKNKKTYYKTFHNVLTNVMPKFGAVKFHFKNNSEERDGQEFNSITETPRTSEKCSIDMKLKKNKNSEKAQNVVTETSDTTTSINCENKISKFNSNNTYNSHAPISYECDKNIKLKEAVVLLTDICKSKNYKHYFKSKSYKNQNNDYESSCNFTVKLEDNCSGKQKQQPEICSIKVENEFCVDNFDVSENTSVDTDFHLQKEKDINNKYNIEKICNRKDQNFTALVEGCNFSDILKRFQIKHSEKYNDIASSNSIVENESGNDEINDDNNEFSYELNKKIKENECIEEEDCEKEPYNDNNLQIEINKTEIDLNEKDFFDENLLDTTKSFSFLQYQNETENDSFASELDVLNNDSMPKFQKMIKGDIEPEFASVLGDSDSDESEIISEKAMNSRGIVDMEVIEHDLSNIRPNAVQENKFEVPETNKSSLSNVTSSMFDLELIKKEMQNRTFPVEKAEENLKSKKSDVKSSPCAGMSSPKKMKFSDGKSKISEQKTKSSKAEDFIRLKASGPTEFSVASLNKVKPSASAAKDFKRKMLFGSRVNRFSSSDQLRIYQLKKEAAKKSVN